MCSRRNGHACMMVIHATLYLNHRYIVQTNQTFGKHLHGLMSVLTTRDSHPTGLMKSMQRR